MNKYLRLIFLASPAFLSLIAGMFANKSLTYIADIWPWSAGFYLSRLVLIIAVICLALGIAMIFRLIGTHIDSIQTRVSLTAGSVLTGLGIGWAFGGILLMMHYPFR